jgi:hypothetical protein
MPVVDTTRTFTNNEQITSTKLNEIMDNSSFVSGAVVTSGGLEVTAGGQMQVATSGITTAKIADLNVTTLKIADANVTQAKLASNVAGNGPAFRAYASSTTAIPNGVSTKVNLATEDFDTGSYFASSRFTPLVAGYYMITGSVDFISTTSIVFAVIHKNGVQNSIGGVGDRSSQVSDLIYLNGTTDYVELFAYQSSGASKNLTSNASGTYLCGCLARSA